MAIHLPGVPSKATLGTPDYLNAFRKGLDTFVKTNQAYHEPRRLQNEEIMRDAQAKYAEPMQELALKQQQANIELLPWRQKLLEAQSQRQSQLANQPFGGMLTGDPKEAYALELLKNQLGEESAPYQNAKKLFESKIHSQDVLNDYRKGLSNTQNTRSLTNFGKLNQEEEDVRAGFLPGSNRAIPIDENQQQELMGQYDLQRLKHSTDVDTRKKSLFASNIDKTLDATNVDDLVQYGGLAGGLQKKIEQGKSLNGNESKAYDNYSKALVGVKLLNKQVRQFYGDSITPQIQEQLSYLTNPSSWINNPTLAKQNFEFFKNILRNETQTYKNSLSNTSEYRNKKNNELKPETQSLINKWNKNQATEDKKYSTADILHTAEEEGITPEEVLSALGVR